MGRSKKRRSVTGRRFPYSASFIYTSLAFEKSVMNFLLHSTIFGSSFGAAFTSVVLPVISASHGPPIWAQVIIFMVCRSFNLYTVFDLALRIPKFIAVRAGDR